jgi:hypothetical protein
MTAESTGSSCATSSATAAAGLVHQRGHPPQRGLLLG